MQIENMISLGHVIVRLITPMDPQPLISELSTLGYGMTRIEGSGSFSHTVSIIFMIVPRKELGRLLGVLSSRYPDILYTVEDVRNIKEGAKIFHKDTKELDPGILRVITFFWFIHVSPIKRSMFPLCYHFWRIKSWIPPKKQGH